MYSVVLMMAMAGGADAPGLGHHRGGCGCCGSMAYGCYGGCWGGCYGGYGCCGMTWYGCCGTAMPAAPAEGPGPLQGPTPRERGPVERRTDLGPVEPDRARIVVSLPAEARLTFEGTPTRSTEAVRAFASPVLEPGQDYVYTLRAEVVQDGRVVAVTKRVRVQAGQESRLALEFPASGVARK